MPHTEHSIICYSILNPCEVASNFTRYTGVGYGHREEVSHSMEALYTLTRRAGLNEVVRGRVLAGNYFLLKENKKKYFEHALKVRIIKCLCVCCVLLGFFVPFFSQMSVLCL